MAASMYFKNKVGAYVDIFYQRKNILLPYPEELTQYPGAKEFIAQCSVRDVIDRWPMYLFMGSPGQPGALSVVKPVNFPLDAPLETQDLAAEVDGEIVAAVTSGFMLSSTSGLFRKYIISMENDTDFTMVVEFNGNWLPLVEQRFYGELLVVDVPAMIAAHEANPDLDQTPAEKLREYMRTGTYPPGTFAFDTFYFYWLPVDELLQVRSLPTTDKSQGLASINLRTTSWVDFHRNGYVGLAGRGFGQAYSYFSNTKYGLGSRLVNQPIVMPDNTILYDAQYLEPDWKRSIAVKPTGQSTYEHMPWHQTCDRQACQMISPKRAAAFKKSGNSSTEVSVVLFDYPPCLVGAIEDWYSSDDYKKLVTAQEDESRKKREEQERQDREEQERREREQREQEREEQERREQERRDWEAEQERQAREREEQEKERQRLEQEQRDADERARQAEQDRQQAEREAQLLIANLVTEENEEAADVIVVQLEDTVGQIILAEQDKRDAQIQSHETRATQLEEEYQRAEENVARLEELQEQIADDDDSDPVTLKEEIAQQLSNNLAIMEAADEELAIIDEQIDEQMAERETLTTQLDSLPENLDEQIEILIEEQSTTTTATTTTTIPVDDGPSAMTIIIIIAVVLGCVWLGFYLRKKSMNQIQSSTYQPDISPAASVAPA